MFAHVNYIFILFLRWPAQPAAQAISRMNKMLKYANFIEADANTWRVDSYDGAWNTKHNNTNFVTISQVLMIWGDLFVLHDSTGQI